MARLTIQQTAAPDFSASGRMLAEAGKTLDRGFETARGVLGDYQAGQEAVGDQALLAELSSHKNRDEYDAFVAGGGLKDLNLSDSGRAYMMDNQARLAGVAGTQASTKLVNADTLLRGAQTASNIDSNDRANAKYADEVAVLNEGRGLTAGWLAAAKEAERLGTLQSGNYQTDDRELLARTLEAEAGGEGSAGMLAAGAVIRNRAATGRYGEGIRGVILRPGQFSAWNGKTDYLDGEGGLDMDNIRVSAEAYAAADQLMSGDYDDPTQGATHYYNDSAADPVWGENKAGGQWDRIGNHVFGFADGGRGTAGASGAVEGYGRPAQAAYDAQLASTKYQTAADVQASRDLVTQARNTGDARIAAAAATANTESDAQAILGLSQDPSLTSLSDVLTASRASGDPDQSAVQQLARDELVISTFGEGGAKADTLLGNSTGLSIQVTEGVKMATDSDTKFLESNPSVLAYKGAEIYSNSDPDQSLAEDLEMLDAQGNVPAGMREAINTLASSFDPPITRAEAAYAFKLAAQSEEGESWWQPNANNWGDRLAQSSAVQKAELFFANGASTTTRLQISEAEVRQSQIAAAQAVADNAARVYQKASANGKKAPAERATAQAALQKLQDVMYPPEVDNTGTPLTQAVLPPQRETPVEATPAAQALSAADTQVPSSAGNRAGAPITAVDETQRLALETAARDTASSRLTGGGGAPTPGGRASTALNNAVAVPQANQNAQQGVNQNAPQVVATPGPTVQASAADVRQIIGILSDPNTPPEVKQQAIQEFADAHGQEAAERLLAVVN